MFVYSALKYLGGGEEKTAKPVEFDEFGDPIGAENVDSSTEALFNSACDFLQTATDRVSQEDLLFFYAHYKQAISGPADPNGRPNIFEQTARKKYDAWRGLKGMSRSDAMFGYIEKLVSLDLGWNSEARRRSVEKAQGGLGSGFGMRPSRPMRAASESGPSELQSSDERWFQAVRAGRFEILKQMAAEQPDLINRHEDETLLTALHLTSDTGNAAVCSFLLDNGALVDAVEVDGQTALHYAVVCANKDVVEILLKHGADVHRVDNDHLSALDICEDDDICELMENAIQEQ